MLDNYFKALIYVVESSDSNNYWFDAAADRISYASYR